VNELVVSNAMYNSTMQQQQQKRKTTNYKRKQ